MQWSVEWLYWAIAGTLAVCSLVLACWALFWDRSRGKRRCPSCWYDLSGSQGFAGDKDKAPALSRCTECGKKPRSERALHRTRRHWRWLPAAGLLLIAADSVRRIPDPDSEGWTRFVPTTAMILVPPMSREEWIEVHFLKANAPNALAKALDKRLTDRRLWDWQEWLWTWKLKRWAGATTAPGLGDEVELAVVDAPFVLELLRGAYPFSEDSRPDSDGFHQRQYYTRAQWKEQVVQHATDLVRRLVAPDSWIDNGGAQGASDSWGDAVVSIQSPANISKLRQVLAMLDRSPSGVDQTDDPASLERDRALLTRLSSHIIHLDGAQLTVGQATRSVEQLGGVHVLFDDGSAAYTPEGPSFRVPMELPQGDWTLKEVLDRIRDTLLERDAYTTSCMWDLHAEGVRFALNEQEQIIRVFDVGDIVTRIQDGPHVETAMQMLIDYMKERVATDKWADNGGEELMLCMGQRLIVTSRSRITFIAFADLLAQLRKDPSPLLQPQ